MLKEKAGRRRVKEVEACRACGAGRGERCVDYRGSGKAACWLPVICRRCAAQPALCLCGYVAPLGAGAVSGDAVDEKGNRLLFPSQGETHVRGKR